MGRIFLEGGKSKHFQLIRRFRQSINRNSKRSEKNHKFLRGGGVNNFGIQGGGLEHFGILKAREGVRGFIKGRAQGKLTSCERGLAMNLPCCFCLLFLLSFIRKTKNALLKNPTDLLHKILMKPLGGGEICPEMQAVAKMAISPML